MAALTRGTRAVSLLSIVHKNESIRGAVVFRYVLVVALFCSVGSPVIYAQDNKTAAANQPLKTVAITDQENGKDVDLPQGEALIVKPAANPTTGYSWAVVGDPAPLKLLKTRNKKGGDSKPMAGAPSVQELKFAASSAGISNLKLEYRRPLEHDVAAVKTFTVKVNVR
jgi:predicted secreted protein